MTEPVWGRPSYEPEPARSWGIQAAISTFLVVVLILVPLFAMLSSRSLSGGLAAFIIIPAALAIRIGGVFLLVYPVLIIWWLVALSAWLLSRAD